MNEVQILCFSTQVYFPIDAICLPDFSVCIFFSFFFFQAGNVVTGEMVEELILSGADIIKVGIGPGG